MRERPIGDLVDALNLLGADVRCEAGNRCPPVIVNAGGLEGGRSSVSGAISSQYLSGLLMTAPYARSAVEIAIEGELVSEPYVEMTRLMMTAFGIEVDELQPGYYAIAPATYRGTQYQIEPDASAASYFFAAAAITGGEITVQGLSRDALQGDVGFVDALVRMGCREEFRAEGVRLTGGDLKGIDVDMNAISDTAQTLAAVAVFADGPTRIRNVAHMRHKETDRITAVATELSRLGIAVEEHEDGLTIHPGQPQPAVIATYDDHRMAMSFALIGLKAEGIRIADPECTQKTYPRFFDDLRSIFGPAT
jgi:3-phosphoshikimate 1-carboxyvinyltransferase